MKPLDFEKPIAELENELEKLQNKSQSQDIDMTDEIRAMEGKLVETRNRCLLYTSPSPRD